MKSRLLIKSTFFLVYVHRKISLVKLKNFIMARPKPMSRKLAPGKGRPFNKGGKVGNSKKS